jgi:uncharacterized protein (DUF4415 family)
MTSKPTFVRYTVEELERMEAEGQSETRADAPRGTPVGPDFWKNARVVLPSGKTSVHLRVDSEVFDWFRQQGNGHLTRMNAVLRSYYEAHRKAPRKG